MGQYFYKAVNNEGRFSKGKMTAESQAELASTLKFMGLELVSCKLEKKGGSFTLFSKIKPRDLITTFIHLEQLDRAGISIIDSIQDLRDSSDSLKIKELMHEIYDLIKNGSLLSESLAKYPDVFKTVYVGLIATGEKTGNFSEAFANIIDDLKWNVDMKRKTRKATIGPTFGLFMMFTVLFVMTSVVVPKVTGFLLSQNIPLPGITLSLIAFSDFIKNYWYLVIFSPPAIWVLMKVLSNMKATEVIIDDFKLKIPVIGPILKKIDTAKFCQFFGMTFKSGLGVIECLDSSCGVIKNKAIKASIEEVKLQVSDGKSLAKSIASVGYFPNLVVRMFKVGEDSGNMETSLNNIKFFYDREINDSIDKLVGMIQPTLTIVMGGMIAWITIAVFGPIYATFSKLG
ncbi:MAG: type II secretion system F family protein [Rickettsiales bacterium]|nr:type II secretion system F family protein [Rickettsiales bacterium]